MRIRRLDLVRFGKFTDQRIEFPAADPDLHMPDLHMIVGANEAGKSTVRAALGDLLFGIGARSTYNFRHAYETMCLGAILERGTDRLEFRRLKKNKDPLRDANDQPLPPERLESFLGRADRNFFERMFALDRRTLEDGGVEILQAKNDLGRMLFEASAGLAGLAPIRQQLEEEAAGLWDKRHSQKRAFSRAREDWTAAKQRLRAVTVQTRDWQDAQQRLATAETKLVEAIAEHARLETERDRLDRIRRVAPHVRKRLDLMAERFELGAVALLPAEAGARLAAARRTIALAETDIARQEALIDKARTERDRISVDHSIIGRRAEIVRLAEQHARVQNHPSDILKRQAEVALLRDEARQLARQLGWQGEDEDTLAGRIATELQRAELRELVSTHVRIEEATRSAAEAVALKARELMELDQELAAVPPTELPPALVPALARACDFGDADAQAKRLHQAVAQAQQRLDRALQELSPWSGSADELRGVCLPGEGAAEERRVAEETSRRRLEGLRERAAGLRREIEVQELAERQIRRDRNPPAAEDIVAARQGRDGLWTRIRAGEAAIAAAGDEYERQVADADALADRRWLSAADVQRLEAVRNAIEERQLELRRCAVDAEAVEAELAAAASAWALTLPAELAGLSPAALPTWAQRRRHALEAADQLAAAVSEVGAFENDLAGLTAALHGALCECTSVIGRAE